MEIRAMEISGVYEILLGNRSDERGDLTEIWSAGIRKSISDWNDFEVAQTNFVNSKLGVIRGIHRLVRNVPQRKVVYCAQGKIDDLIVDLRPESETFKKWLRIGMNEEKNSLLLIPHRIGHSFQTLTSNSKVIYQMDTIYQPNAEININPFDEELGLIWTEEAMLSEKDSNASSFSKFSEDLL